MEVEFDRIQKDLATINSFNATPEKGITRFTFSKEYMAARLYVIEELRKIGGKVTTGIAGNVRGRIEGTEADSSAVMVGSHIDTVFQGGRYDGVVGVASALEAARRIVEGGIPHHFPVDVVIFAEEEGSRFQSGLLGSRAWVGMLRADDLSSFKDCEGVNYLEAMWQASVVPDDLTMLNPKHIKAMLELHIEQSVVLEKEQIPIGVIEAIAGFKQFLVTIHGVSNHAGGTPMGLRFDALQGASRIISAVEEIAIHQVSKNTVATVGFLECEPGQANVIPGRVQFTLDIRDTDSKLIAMAVNKIMEAISSICCDRGLTYTVQPRSDTPPVTLSRNIVQLIEKCAQKKGIKTLKMVSGALHDSSIMADLTEAGMIFIPSKGGRSHCPEEHTNQEHIKLGADILLNTVVELAS